LQDLTPDTQGVPTRRHDQYEDNRSYLKALAGAGHVGAEGGLDALFSGTCGFSCPGTRCLEPPLNIDYLRCKVFDSTHVLKRVEPALQISDDCPEVGHLVADVLEARDFLLRELAG
jgi:hypothetical protein